MPMGRPGWVFDALDNPTGRGVRVGVIDSGWDIRATHPQVRPGIGLLDPDDELCLRSGWEQSQGDWRDRIGHGTACADLVARVAPEADLYPIRVFGRRLETSVSVLVAALEWAIQKRMHVVNLSLGTLREDALYPLYAACKKACEEGLIIVAATSNAQAWSFPAVFDNVVGVARGAFRSSFDYVYRAGEAVECLAHGERQQVLWLGGRRCYKTGNSYAAPNISGIIALFLERYPGARLEHIRRLLEMYACK